jgi:hypothetical protein
LFKIKIIIMKLFIPEIGDLLKLTEDWKFTLYQEYRNQLLIKCFSPEYVFKYSETGKIFDDITFPKGTVLCLDRIYIRKGASDFSSLSFFIKESPQDGLKGKRFWAKLKDCNKIYFEFIKSQNITLSFKLNYEFNSHENHINSRTINTSMNLLIERPLDMKISLSGSNVREGELNYLYECKSKEGIIYHLKCKIKWEYSHTETFNNLSLLRPTRRHYGKIIERKFTAVLLETNEELFTVGSLNTAKTKIRKHFKENLKNQ